MCIQRAVKQGQVAPIAFCNFRALLDRMDDAGKHAAVGRPNYALLSSGLATWGDIVTPNRVREFHEVMDRKRLTVDQMVMHGVDRLDAEVAWALVHTPEREEVDRQRRELLQKIAASGVDREALVNATASRLAQRVGLETPAKDKAPRKRKPRALTASGREVDERMVSDDVLKAISEKRVLEALGPADAAKVTTTIMRDANGWPSAKFACPDDLKGDGNRGAISIDGSLQSGEQGRKRHAISIDGNLQSCEQMLSCQEQREQHWVGRKPGCD